jgi:hypothetical protein
MADAAIRAGDEDGFLRDLHVDLLFWISRLLFAGPFLPLYLVKPAGWSKLIGSAGIFLFRQLRWSYAQQPEGYKVELDFGGRLIKARMGVIGRRNPNPGQYLAIWK